MSFSVGENVGPYRIVEKLGQGGMATVYKAYHASLDRYVALKALHPAFNEDKSFASRFQREARVVAKLEHPNIVPVYDYAEDESRPFLVMKFIEGDTLKARLDLGPLTAAEISRIVEAVGSALAYAHKQGILHRDIKPSNVLLAADGQIYLADFGLARIAQSGESTLSSDTIMGTPQYISPEQAMGLRDLDQRTDLYSFGVMLYEMVVGRVPFNADTPFAIIHDHIYSPLPVPHLVNPNVPAPVERVLLKSLAKERDDRYEDATELIGAFKAAWSEAGVPMQGTFIRVSQAMQPLEKSAAPPVRSAPAAPTKIAAPVNVTEANGQTMQKRSPWIWVGVGLAILLCAGIVWFARSNRLIAGLIRSRNNPPVATIVAVVNNPPSTPTNLIADTAVPPPPQPAGAEADAHLNLALDAWHNKDLKRSMDEVQQTVSLRADENDFLIRAGTQLSDAGQYIGAAYVYGSVVQNSKSAHQPIPPEVRDQLESSFYFATAMDGLPLYIPLDTLKNNDPPLAFFVQARYALLHGKMDAAHQNLNELLRLQPDWPMAQLLNAEILIHDHKLLEARKILQDLIQSPRTQAWVRDQAGILLNNNQ
ncbi:MAG TPA: serine/threonine-protein kinase [Anaerolineales bacterium]|nr:serine/threonine-protein kinase [Anaerolineales bacterium]